MIVKYRGYEYTIRGFEFKSTGFYYSLANYVGSSTEILVNSNECEFISGNYFPLYIKMLNKYKEFSPLQREGQRAMNVLRYLNDGKLYGELSGTNYDTFNSTDKKDVLKLYKKLQKEMILWKYY